MSVALTTSPGGLFTRLSKAFAAIKTANYYLGNGYIGAAGMIAVGRSALDLLAQYEDAQQELAKGVFTTRDSARGALTSVKNDMAALAQQTVITMVDDDATLTALDLTVALKELIRQMKGAGTIYAADNDLDASAVSGAATARVGNTGTGVLRVSVKRGDARDNELVFAETLEADCDGDAQGGGTARSETFAVRGELLASGVLEWDYPGGSGSSQQITSIDSELDAQSAGNQLTNSDFADFTVAHTPDYWPILVGAAGTDIFSETSVVYRTGKKALKFTGTAGVPLSSVAQAFDSSEGTTTVLEPNTVYNWNFFARKSAGLAAGSIAVSLLDGANAVVNDDAGNANTTTIANGTLTASFAAYGGTIITPRVLPTSGLKLRVSVTVALTNTESVYIADLALAPGKEMYTSGPFVNIFSGAVDWLLEDHIDLAIANDYAGEMQQWCDRVFGLKALRLQFPTDTASTETIDDTLIDGGEIPQVVATIDPANLNGATTTSDIIDMDLFGAAVFILAAGAIDAAVDFKLQSDALVGFGSGTDIPGKVIVQATGGTQDNSQWVIYCRRTDLPAGERFVRASVTVAAGTTNLGCLIALGLQPVAGLDAANDLATVLQIID